MLPVALLLATSLQTQTPPPATTPPTDAEALAASERAAQAAERAAQAAERSAEASARMAAAAERLAAALERLPPAAPAEAEKKPAEEKKEAKPDTWVGSAGLGLIALSGNSSTLTFNGLASVERKTEDWAYSARAFGVYGRSTLVAADGTEQSQVVALSASLQLRGDRRFTNVISGYLLAGAETDHIKSVEFRGIGEGGAGILWWDVKGENGQMSSLRTDLAFRFARETRFQYYPTRTDLPDVDIGGPRLGVTFNYGLSKDVVFSEDAEVVSNVIGDSRVLFNSRSKLLAGLTDSLSLGATFLVQYDSAPPPGKVDTDTSLSLSLEVAF